MTITELPLNFGQKAAADGFFDFLFNKEKELIISGPGGVGKTFLMGYLIDKILPQYFDTCALMGIKPEFDEVIMTATTNKAADVLWQSTGRPTSTIHSFMNLKVQDDYSTGKSVITKTRNWKVHSNKIIFIDECSMVDRSLLSMVREGTMNCKIIWVGDHCQLAPIFEPISPIYNGKLPFYELTEPMRTNNPDLQALNLQLRETVETGVFKPIKVVPGVIDLLDSDQMEQKVISVFGGGNTQSRVLAYTNNRVIDYNQFIRDIRQVKSTYVVGERLINNSAVQFSTGMLSVEAEVTIDKLSDKTVMIEIEPEVELECWVADISGHERFTDVNLPADKDHYNQLIKYYQKAKRWNKYFELKNNFPDLRQPDAATVHKSQGSTYDSVLIDLSNISTCHNPNQAARMLYVAFSRARHNVFMYGELAEKYGGIIL